MTVHVGAREARDRFADLIGSVHYGGEVVIVERSGKPMVAMIPIEMFERHFTEREKRFAKLEALRESIPQYSIEEVEQDVAEAITAVRAAKRAVEN